MLQLVAHGPNNVSGKSMLIAAAGRILELMTPSAANRRHISSSPFKREPEPAIKQFAIDDRVAHDTYGVGRVIGAALAVVTVDFGTQTVRIISPFDKLEKL